MLLQEQEFMRFYSKLVRLKDVDVQTGKEYEKSFLFQTGAIKRQDDEAVFSLWISKFLFQTGAIKRRLQGELETANESFYSKLVRLKVKREACMTKEYFRVSIPNWCD